MKITQTQCDTLAKCHQLITTGYTDEWDELYIEPGDSCVVLTRDTNDQLKNNKWAEATGFSEEQHEGFTVLHWENMQGKKGEERGHLTVVDFGEFRAIYK